MTAYPSSTEYAAAVQDPQRVFRAPNLRRARFATDPLLGIPVPSSGSAAVVFRATVDGRDQALRFFIREDASEERRYTALGRHFADHGLDDCVAATTWFDNAITVKGHSWPMIQMEWIEGRTLDAYVGHLVGLSNVGALHVLAGGWRHRVQRLQEAEFAHGDLQHGNVLVDTSGALRLVDFDGSWIGRFQGWPPPSETGNPNYQRPDRVWGRWMDSFPALVIYTGLLAVSRRPDIWATLHDGENMLFSGSDFVHPGRTRTWAVLEGIDDSEVSHALQRLRACCGQRWNAASSLEGLLGRERIERPARPASQAPSDPPPLFVLSDNPRLDWYADTAIPPPPPKRVAPPSDVSTPPFAGVRGPVHTGSWQPHSTPIPPTSPRPVPAPQQDKNAIAAAACIALAFALIIGVSVGTSGLPAALIAALIAAVVAFAIALPLLRLAGRR
jgi:hypothetical protein